jgi:peptide deformylase
MPIPQKITTIGAPVLRELAHPLTRQEILSPTIQELIEQMRETMHSAPGVGLAAPQVGLPLQLAVIEDKAEYHKDIPLEQLAERERRPVRFHVIINPKLTLEPGSPVEFFEGCLSLPGFVALVPRASQVRVECLDHHGKPQTIRARGWHARILQHEIDHLSGTLYVDRMHTRTLCTLDHYTAHWKARAIEEVKHELKIT